MVHTMGPEARMVHTMGPERLSYPGLYLSGRLSYPGLYLWV